MIVQGLLNFIATVISKGLDLIPDLSPGVGDAISSVPDYANQAMAYVGKLERALPFEQINVAVHLVVAGALVAFGIRAVKIALSFASGGGGE